MRNAIKLLIILGFFISPNISNAIATKVDIKVAARTFNFIKGFPSGNITIGIIYDAGIANSRNDANTVHDILSDGMKAGKYTLKSVLVPLDKISSTTMDVAYLTEGLGSKAEQAFIEVSNKQKLCFTTDSLYIANKHCVMGVSSKPSIKIEISRLASDNSGIEFEQALTLMVEEKE